MNDQEEAMSSSAYATQSSPAAKRMRGPRGRGSRRWVKGGGWKPRSGFRQTIPTRLPGFPSNKIVKMRYTDGFSIAQNTSTNVVRHVFSLSSIYDPDQSGAGHQPIGHDQWGQFYNHYCVLGAKITAVDCLKDFNSNTEPFGLTVKIDDDGTTGTTNYSIPELVERASAGQYAVSSGTLAASEPVSAVNFYSTKKFFNIADVKDNLTRLGAGFGSSPGEQAFGVVCIGTWDGSNFSTTNTHSLMVTIDYIVMLSEPKDIAAS